MTTIRHAPPPAAPGTPAADQGGSRAAAAVAGLAAGGLALAVADLLAQLTDPAASPLLAVGATFVDHTPQWLKDTAIAWFGVRDKLALFTGMALVAAVLCVGIGLLARRSARALVLAGSATAVLGALAASSRPGARPWWGLPSLVGVLAGVAVLHLLVNRCRRTDRTVSGPRPARRTVLHTAGVAVAAGAVGSASRAAAVRRGTAPDDLSLPPPREPAAPAPPDEQVAGLTPWRTANREFYRIDTALSVPRLDADRWRLRVHGMVQRELELSLADLLDGPLVERWVTLTCVSNEVGGRLAGNARWLGHPLARLLAAAGPHPDADMVLSTSSDGYTASTPLEAMTDGRGALVAVGMNGEPLPQEHGFPARLVVPGLYGYVSATKWLVDLEITRFDRRVAYWTSRGYAAQAPIRTASRIDVPAPFAQVPAGPVAVAGMAWAQQRGIDAVDVRVDGGPWHRARLSPALSDDTWRQWVWTWDATAGQHTLQVAATDGSGARQEQLRRTPRPDGATGWHSVAVQVT